MVYSGSSFSSSDLGVSHFCSTIVLIVSGLGPLYIFVLITAEKPEHNSDDFRNYAWRSILE